MIGARGATVIELLVACAIMLAASAAALTLVSQATTQSPRWNEAADLHQRVHVAVDAIARHVALAGGGPPLALPGPAFPALEPRRRSSFLLSDTAVTIRHVPEGAAWTRLSADLPPGATSASIEVHSGCAAGIVACGFVGPVDAAVFNGQGSWDLLTVASTGPTMLALTERVGGRTVTFGAGSPVVELQEASLYFDRATGTLRQEGPGQGNFPIVDHVGALVFEYFDDRLERIPISSLSDGPLCGSGALAYDCDLRRIRTVRATLTIEAAHPETRDLQTVVDSTIRRLSR